LAYVETLLANLGDKLVKGLFYVAPYRLPIAGLAFAML
jgi:cobalamin biosynthesis protein CobD/CbiB